MAKRVNLPKRLKQWRKREKIDKHEAAVLLNINYFTYLEYESGRRGKGMSGLQYDHIIALTAPNGTKPKDASAVESSPV